ncbi:DnaB-like helicase C-terminal domain-containing protein [Roseococcus pinisoli]|uniref:SF4 helicase domain-containing protein n=1 Tax=Roseococcus pinisoli TaxID=2835040 RepID=A0ABS5QIG1_9PROT|nr:DnaB-like helicase C-terminal domain-containing protein [Roseococcus pinisoli]MBS7812328.1 hypothetical protein [Roseococcus pinisoli]
MSLLAQSFVASIVDSPKGLELLLEVGDPAPLFVTEPDQKLWSFVSGHLTTHGKLPHRSTIAAVMKIDLPQALEPASFYQEKLTEFFVRSSLGTMATGIQEHIGAAAAQELLAAAQEAMNGILKVQMQRNLHDFRHAAPAILKAHNLAQVGGAVGFSSGWPSFDKQAAGLRQGDVISIVGRPAAGKSWLLLWIALYMWRRHKLCILFVSMELDQLAVMQRLSGIYGQVAAGQVVSGQLSTKTYNAFRVTLSGLEDEEVPFWVLDANLAGTVDDVAALQAMLQPDATLIDGAYMLTHPKESDIYKRVALNANLIKQKLAKRGPVVASWQFARTAKKKPKGEKPGMEDIAYSDVIPQVSSIVMAIMEDDSTETSNTREVAIVKGRGGQVGSFRVNWNFAWTTDFSEFVEHDPMATGQLDV